MIRHAYCILIPSLTLFSQGCLVKRATESGSRVTEEKYIVKNLIQNTEVE